MQRDKASPEYPYVELNGVMGKFLSMENEKSDD
jgi:hypothetical protein